MGEVVEIWRVATPQGRERTQRQFKSAAGKLLGEPRLPRPQVPGKQTPRFGNDEPEDQEPAGRRRLGPSTLLTGPLGLPTGGGSAVKGLLGG